jgi:hypothetical protein
LFAILAHVAPATKSVRRRFRGCTDPRRVDYAVFISERPAVDCADGRRGPTIIGYSINDKTSSWTASAKTSNWERRQFPPADWHCVEPDLSRTIITGGAVILTLALLFFGGGVINDFAFTFLVIPPALTPAPAIASPFVLWWHKGERPGSVRKCR